jgi:hypothetical protein
VAHQRQKKKKNLATAGQTKEKEGGTGVKVF